MPRDTVIFNNKNLYDVARCRVISKKHFWPEGKERKIEIDSKSGSIDYGGLYHKEGIILLDFIISDKIESHQLDDLKYFLDRTGRLIMWDEPDRYYFGRAYNSPVQETRARNTSKQSYQFSLEFKYQSYAKAHDPTTIKSDNNIISTMKENAYLGSRRAPTIITIRNTGSSTISKIRVTAYRKRDVSG